MKHLEVSCAVRPIEWLLGVRWLSSWMWRYVSGLQLRQYTGHVYGTSFSARTAVFCTRFGILAVVLLKIRDCSDVSFRKIVLPLSSVSK